MKLSIKITDIEIIVEDDSMPTAISAVAKALSEQLAEATEATSTPMATEPPIAAAMPIEPTPVTDEDNPCGITIEEKEPTITQADAIPTLAPAANTSTQARKGRPTLPFEEFDALVRSEMQRLSTDGVMPSHSAWNKGRDKQLPTLAAIMWRYDCTNLYALASKLGMAAPATAHGKIVHRAPKKSSAPDETPAVISSTERTVEHKPYEPFDQLVRSEMKRLGDGDMMPSYSRWNNERDPRLPTMASVIIKYGCGNLRELAQLLEMEPPMAAVGNPTNGKGDHHA